MKNKSFVVVFSLLISLSLGLGARAQFDFFTPLTLDCNNPTGQTTLNFIPGAPSGDYMAFVEPLGDNLGLISIGGGSFGEPASLPFNVPAVNNSGLPIPIGLDTDSLPVDSFFDVFVDIQVSPGDLDTIEAGFAVVGSQIRIINDGCFDPDPDPDPEVPELVEGLVDVEHPHFQTVDIADVAAETNNDLKVTLSIKIDKAIFDIVQASLKDGEDIKDKLIELADKFGIKFDFKKLKKLAQKELKEAGKGKKGKEKEDAIKEAKGKGFNKLVSIIRMKLPPLPPKKAPESAREAAKKIRKAKKKKILEALEINVDEIKDGTKDGKAVKCVTFTLTLPGKVCEKKSKKTAAATLEPGESVKVEVPVKVVGFYQEFFGEPNKKGILDGKIEMDFEVENPAL